MTQKIKFKVEGIKCPSCPTLIEDRVGGIDGVSKVKVSEESGVGVALYDDKETNASVIFTAIENIRGFKVKEIDSAEEKKDNKETDSEIKCPHCGKAISICVK